MPGSRLQSDFSLAHSNGSIAANNANASATAAKASAALVSTYSVSASATADTASAVLAATYATTASQAAALAVQFAATATLISKNITFLDPSVYNYNILLLSQINQVTASQAAAVSAQAQATAAQAAAAGAQVASVAATAFMAELKALATVVIPSSGPSTSIQNMSAFYYFSLFPFRYANATFKQPLYIRKFLVDTILNNGYKTQLYGYSDLEFLH